MQEIKRFALITAVTGIAIAFIPLSQKDRASITTIAAEITETTIESTEETTTEVQEAETVIDEVEGVQIYRISVSAEDIDLIAKVVMSEASAQSYTCKVAIAETIINRVLSDRFPNTVKEVVTSKGQYSIQNNGEVTPDCYNATFEALTEQKYPSDMYYFRSDHYHTWAVDYIKIDSMFFSRGEQHG